MTAALHICHIYTFDLFQTITCRCVVLATKHCIRKAPHPRISAACLQQPWKACAASRLSKGVAEMVLKVLMRSHSCTMPCGKQPHNQALMAVGPGKQRKQLCLNFLCNAQVCGPEEPRQQLLHEQRPAGALDAAISAEALCCQRACPLPVCTCRSHC